MAFFTAEKSLLKVCHDPNFFFNKRENFTLINEQENAEKSVDSTLLRISTKKCAKIEILSTANLRLTPRTSVNARLRSHRWPKNEPEHKQSSHTYLFTGRCGQHSWRLFLMPVALLHKAVLNPFRASGDIQIKLQKCVQGVSGKYSRLYILKNRKPYKKLAHLDTHFFCM